MTARASRRGFAARPGDVDRWIRSADPVPAATTSPGDAFTARLTIDVTPALRRRMKLVAVTRGTTVADMLRALFAREFPDEPGVQS